MTAIQKLLSFISLLLMIPLLLKIRMLLTGQLPSHNFFRVGVFFNVKVENFLSFLGILFFLVFLFLRWYQVPELR